MQVEPKHRKRAVNDFLRNDVLAPASANTQARPHTKPDPDLKVRTALDLRRESRGFPDQPLVEPRFGRPSVKPTSTSVCIQKRTTTGACPRCATSVIGRRPSRHAVAATLGDVYTYAGKYAESESLLAKAFELSRRVLGGGASVDTPDHERPGAELFSRKEVFGGGGTFTREVEIQRRVLGDEDDLTLSSMNNLAMLHYRQAEACRPRPFRRRWWKSWRRLLGEENPKTITAMNNLGLMYQALGQYSQAEPLYVKVVDLIRRVLGDEHPNTLTATANLAELCQRRGKYAKAEPLFARALAVGRRVLGEQNPNTLSTMKRLADLCGMMKANARRPSRFTSASWKAGVERSEMSIPTRWRARSRLAIALLQRKDAEAEAALRAALKDYEIAAPDSWNRYHCQSLLGGELAGQKRFAEAEPFLIAGYEGMVQREAMIAAPDRCHSERSRI